MREQAAQFNAATSKSGSSAYPLLYTDSLPHARHDVHDLVACHLRVLLPHGGLMFGKEDDVSILAALWLRREQLLWC